MAFAFVSGTNVGTDNGTAPTTSAVNTTGVDLLIISCGYFNSAQDGTLPTVSDSKGNTWTALTVHNCGFNAAHIILYAKNPTVGSGHTFTISTSYSSICVAGFSGSDTTAPFDVQNGAGNSSTASLATGSITPSAANELIIDGGMNAGGTSLTSIGSGFTLAQTNNGGSSSFPSALGYKIQTTATAENPTLTVSAAGQMGVSIASFKAAAAGGTVYTLTATVGAVTLAGTTTGVSAARVLAATAGAVALAGTTTGVSAARVLAATTGAIALAGTTTGLAAARVLAAATGAITLAGNAADLVKTGVGYVLTATTGAVALAGNAINFLQGYVIGVTPGAVVVTRANANLVYGQLNQYVLGAQTGAIVVDGQWMEFDAWLLEKQPGTLSFGRKAYIPARW